MGIRETQYYGLNKKALGYVNANSIKEKYEEFIDGKRVSKTLRPKMREYKHKFTGMFGEAIPLYKYYMGDGSILKEVVQSTPWSSGMCIFTCLEKEKGVLLFEWAKEKINEVI